MRQLELDPKAGMTLVAPRGMPLGPWRRIASVSCYNGTYDCARFDLPVDWLDPSDEERVVLAIIKLRATERDDYRGPVIFNPSGPRGSGVFALKDRGDLLQTIIGPNNDLISFDRRGIGASQSQLWELQDVGIVDAHPGTLYDAFAWAIAFLQVYTARMMGKSNLFARAGLRKGEVLGFSYGTILGGVFAAMYSDMVKRLASDGNVDYQEWHCQTHINFLHDTDKVMCAFYKFCHQAGPTSFDFYAETPKLIKKRLETLLEHIREPPVIRYATVLAALEVGDGRPFYNFQTLGTPVCSIEVIPPNVPHIEEANSDAFAAILCADQPLQNDTVEAFAGHVHELTEISDVAGDVNAFYLLACVGRTVRPKWRYDGPCEGNTSFPILYVANVADNIKPLVSATNNSLRFLGSVVLVQNSYGHTSLSAASACTAEHFHNYFQYGQLPQPGATCEPDSKPFQQVSVRGKDDLAVALHELSRANGVSYQN
ncbi:Alpha/Beta hydrolase protein [Xylariaceae sp. FL1651]|nr:Alpha/Beta hydrolase protein [Xylariaceae sp. FL1651]